VGYRAIPIETPLRDYQPPELQIECIRCKRSANLKVQAMAKRFGMNVAIGDLVRQVALAGERPCGLAGTGQCSARAWEPPPWHWADLDRAWRGGWIARLRCRRNRAGLKASKPCPEIIIVDVETLVATLGYDFKLKHLPSRMQCPRCHSQLVDVEWIVPDPTPAPFAPAADVVPLRLKPTPAQKALRRLRVVDGSGD